MHTKQLIKPTITLGMIALVAYSVSFEKLIQTLREIELSTVVIVVLGYGVGQLISSVKWWLIARSGGIDVSYSSQKVCQRKRRALLRWLQTGSTDSGY
jgi:uncharacterized membrane protein YbhN (UPF0104 family)